MREVTSQPEYRHCEFCGCEFVPRPYPAIYPRGETHYTETCNNNDSCSIYMFLEVAASLRPMLKAEGYEIEEDTHASPSKANGR